MVKAPLVQVQYTAFRVQGVGCEGFWGLGMRLTVWGLGLYSTVCLERRCIHQRLCFRGRTTFRNSRHNPKPKTPSLMYKGSMIEGPYYLKMG